MSHHHHQHPSDQGVADAEASVSAARDARAAARDARAAVSVAQAAVSDAEQMLDKWMNSNLPEGQTYLRLNEALKEANAAMKEANAALKEASAALEKREAALKEAIATMESRVTPLREEARAIFSDTTAIARDLPILDLLELSHTCVAAWATVARHLVGPLILRRLLELAREALAMRGQEPKPYYWIDDDWWLPCAAVAIRGCIDLRHLFDLQHMDVEVAAVLQSILPRLQPENCCGSDFGRLERLLLDAILAFGGDANASTAVALEL
ncbi:hypothetical protein HK405_006061, partial [Cladochytrium tenue]